MTELYAGGRCTGGGRDNSLDQFNHGVSIVTLWLLSDSAARVRLVGFSVTHYVYDS